MKKIEALITLGFITESDVVDYYTEKYITPSYGDNNQGSDWDDYSPYENYDPFPEYVIASTSEVAEETYVFPATENG